MHRRLDAAVAGAGLGRGLGYVLEPRASLAAMPQNVSLVSCHEHPGIGGRCRAANEDADAVFAVAHGSLRTLAVDQDRNHDPARTAELKAVACRPGGIRLRRAFRRGFLGIVAIK